MAEVKIAAEVREEFGKGAARRLRRQEKVPAVIYGHGAEPAHVALPGYDLMMALKTPNVLISLEINGKSELVIPTAVQREAIRGFLGHVDLLTVKRGEKVTVDVPIQIEGDLAPGGNLLEHMLNALPVECEATNIPQGLTVSIQDLSAGDTVHASDVTLPVGTTLAVSPDEVVLQVLAAQAEEVTSEEEEEGEA